MASSVGWRAAAAPDYGPGRPQLHVARLDLFAHRAVCPGGNQLTNKKAASLPKGGNRGSLWSS